MMKKKISVVFSFFNEAEVLPGLLNRLNKVFAVLDFDFEFIFVNDASTDASLEILQGEAKINPHLKILNMARNFGVYPCFLAGIKYAKGDAVITMDTDLQDPPELIPQVVTKWVEGADVVYTVRSRRLGEPFWKLILTKCGYRLLKIFSQQNLPLDAGDFRLMSRRFIEELLKLPECQPYFKGLIPWLGFKRALVCYERGERAAGKTHMPILSGLTASYPVRLFISGLTSFSVLPLYFSAFVGMLLIFGTLLYFLLFLFKIGPVLSLSYLFLLFLAGIQLLCIGILGFYLGRVYLEQKRRPNYVIESKIGFED